MAYDSDSQFDPYCFGTGFLGGWADGVLTFITINDAQQDTIRILPQGQLLFETHPGFTAPWVPDLGDGDLLITGEFDPITWDLLSEDKRYLLQEVTPRTIRGEKKHRAGYKVHQQGNLDKLPDNHRWLEVPIVFDYTSVPPAPVVPPGGDPDDYPTGYSVSSTEFVVMLYGEPEGLRSNTTIETRLSGLGTTTSAEFALRLNAEEEGSHVIFDQD